MNLPLLRPCKETDILDYALLILKRFAMLRHHFFFERPEPCYLICCGLMVTAVSKRNRIERYRIQNARGQSDLLQYRKEILLYGIFRAPMKSFTRTEIINQVESDPKQHIKRIGELIELHRMDAGRSSAYTFISSGLRKKVKCISECFSISVISRP